MACRRSGGLYYENIMERPQAAPKHDPAERSCFGEEERPMSDHELERIEGAVYAVIFKNE